jgi:predicted HicB family RNase H-like nuclease
MKSDMMKYKGYKATIAYDEDDKIFVGEVFGVEDSLNFHGNSIDELEKAFQDCIENYLNICKQIGKEPQKEFSGTFNVRTTSQIHKRASEYAAENGYSLNQVVSMAMETFLGDHVKAN